MRFIDSREIPPILAVSEARAVEAGRTLAHAEAEGCIILVHSADPPSDTEWNRWLEALSRYLLRTSRARMLVMSQGGAPNPSQRRASDAVTAPHHRDMKVAVVTQSTFVRGVVAAFRVLLPFYRAYAPRELEAALAYLDVPSDRVRQVESRLETLGELGSSGRPAITGTGR
jgi:hypothetical protein